MLYLYAFAQSGVLRLITEYSRFPVIHVINYFQLEEMETKEDGTG